MLVVAGIYLTIGPALALTGVLTAEQISSGFWIGLILLAASVLIAGLVSRPTGVFIAAAIGVAGAYLIVLLRMTEPAERSHMIEYTIVALLIFAALKERIKNGSDLKHPTLLAVVITITVGTLDELIQIVIPDRFFTVQDILFNSLAAVMAVTAVVLLTWARDVGGRIISS